MADTLPVRGRQGSAFPRNRWRGAFLLFACLVPAICSASQSSSMLAVSEKEQILRRQQMVRILSEEFNFVWDPEILEPVAEVARILSRAVGASENAYHIYVIDKPGINAFTSPLGDIFFFTGTLAQLKNRSELAGVVAHEIAHVRAGHFQELARTQALGAIPSLMAAILSRGDPRVIASTLAVVESYQLHFSRDMESESDRLSVQYMKNTPFDPKGLLGALKVIETAERFMPSGVPESLMTHPVTSSRIAGMEEALGMAPGQGYEPAEDPSWNRLRAVLDARSGNQKRMEERYRERLKDGTASSRNLLGLLLLNQGKYGEAAAELKAAHDMERENLLYASDYGIALFHLGRFEEARPLLVMSLDGETGSRPYYYLGEMYRDDGDNAAAMEAYQRAVALSPPISEAHYQLALLLSGKNSLGEADFHFGRADLLRGNYSGALGHFTRAKKRFPENSSWRARIEAELRRMR